MFLLFVVAGFILWLVAGAAHDQLWIWPFEMVCFFAIGYAGGSIGSLILPLGAVATQVVLGLIDGSGPKPRHILYAICVIFGFAYGTGGS